MQLPHAEATLRVGSGGFYGDFTLRSVARRSKPWTGATMHPTVGGTVRGPLSHAPNLYRQSPSRRTERRISLYGGRWRKGGAPVGVVTDMAAQNWRLVTLATAAVTGAVVTFMPLMSTSSCSTMSAGASSCTSSRASLVSTEGGAVLAILAIPALIALLPLVVPSGRSTFVAAAALTAVTLLGLMSVGPFFIPTVALAWIAVSASKRSSDNQQPHRSVAP